MKIAIVGAGLIGRLLALYLHRQTEFKISLFDSDTKLAHNSAAYAAAGLLTPLGESLHCDANIVAMGFESLTLWPKILASLDEPVFFQQAGTIMVSHEQDKGDHLHFTRHLQHHYPESKQHPENKQQWLNRAQLLALEPELGRSFNQGLYLPQEGQIDNRYLLIALRKQLEKEGIQWFSETFVTAIKKTNHGRTLSYQTKNHTKAQKEESQAFDLVIDCRGTGATNKKASDSNAPLPDLRSVRGEVFRLFAPDVYLSRPIRLMHPRYQLYIAPKEKGFYVVGATEIESDDNANITVRSAMELLSAAYSVHPGFGEANIHQHISQSRPAFSNNQPKIIVRDSLIQINGLFRHGYLISPVVLQQVLGVINNKITGNTQTLPYSHLLAVDEIPAASAESKQINKKKVVS